MSGSNPAFNLGGEMKKVPVCWQMPPEVLAIVYSCAKDQGMARQAMVAKIILEWAKNKESKYR